jgi:hypothetical protein
MDFLTLQHLTMDFSTLQHLTMDISTLQQLTIDYRLCFSNLQKILEIEWVDTFFWAHFDFFWDSCWESGQIVNQNHIVQVNHVQIVSYVNLGVVNVIHYVPNTKTLVDLNLFCNVSPLNNGSLVFEDHLKRDIILYSIFDLVVSELDSRAKKSCGFEPCLIQNFR